MKMLKLMLIIKVLMMIIKTTLVNGYNCSNVNIIVMIINNINNNCRREKNLYMENFCEK